MEWDDLNALIKEAVGFIATSARPSVFSGAGMSQESGIATYRGAEDGLWTQYDIDEVATAFALHQNPRKVWEFFQKNRAVVNAAQPNAGHQALAALEAAYVCGLPIITQNIDDLHERAGSRQVIHLHGELMQNRCSRYCQGIGVTMPDDVPTIAPHAELPRCPHCAALLRPDVILFGEYLHGDVYEQAQAVASQTDVMLVIGTSGLVAPASKIPLSAQDHGATLIEINPQPSRITPNVDIFIPASAGQALPHLLHILEECLQ
jgi:NAD-dependent deacetylase